MNQKVVTLPSFKSSFSEGKVTASLPDRTAAGTWPAQPTRLSSECLSVFHQSLVLLLSLSGFGGLLISCS